MKLLARLERDAMAPRWVRLARNGRRYQLQIRPRLDLGGLIAVQLPGCPAPTDDAIAAWLEHAYRERPVGVLRPQTFAPATLADFADALNAAEHIEEARAASTDALVRFAREQGGRLLADLRAAIAGDARLADLPDRVRRFAMVSARHPVSGEPGNDASRVLDELAGQHDVEHLLGLEHAVARWVSTASDPRVAELDHLARSLPESYTSAGVSQQWFEWWRGLALACTRVDLMTIVDRAVDLADEQCAGPRVAAEARGEARTMAGRMRTAIRAKLWSDPRGSSVGFRADLDDAHYTAFMALTHAAHALAHARSGELGPRDANRSAMRTLADLAIQFLRDDPGD